MLFLGGVFPKSRINDWDKTSCNIGVYLGHKENKMLLGLKLLGRIKLRGTALKNWKLQDCKTWAHHFDDLPESLLKISFVDALSSQKLKGWIFTQLQPHVKSLTIDEIDLHWDESSQ